MIWSKINKTNVAYTLTVYMGVVIFGQDKKMCRLRKKHKRNKLYQIIGRMSCHHEIGYINAQGSADQWEKERWPVSRH